MRLTVLLYAHWPEKYSYAYFLHKYPNILSRTLSRFCSYWNGAKKMWNFSEKKTTEPFCSFKQNELKVFVQKLKFRYIVFSLGRRRHSATIKILYAASKYTTKPNIKPFTWIWILSLHIYSDKIFICTALFYNYSRGPIQLLYLMVTLVMYIHEPFFPIPLKLEAIRS